MKASPPSTLLGTAPRTKSSPRGIQSGDSILAGFRESDKSFIQAPEGSDKKYCCEYPADYGACISTSLTFVPCFYSYGK